MSVILENTMEKVRNQSQKLGFSQVLRECREAMGIKRYRAAEFLCMSKERLRNLEIAFFRVKPRDSELKAIAKFYGLSYDMLDKKAEESIDSIYHFKRKTK